MSTLRISNIEAKSVPASATTDEKIKITNSSGDVLVFIDGKTSGITTVGINTTDGNIKFDENSNIVVTGIITATKFVGAIEPTELTVSGNVSVGGSVTAATFYGSGANLTNLPTQVTINTNADNRVITGGSGVNLYGESTLTYSNPTLEINTDTSPYGGLILNGNSGGLIQFEDNEVAKWSIFGTDASLNFYDNPNSASRILINPSGKIGFHAASPITRFQVGNATFNGGHGMYSNDRVGMANHGYLTGLMLASTYNDAGVPEYGLVFVQGPTTSNYNCWSISPDGPAKGNSLSLHYGAQNTNIHILSNRKFEFDGDGDFNIIDGNVKVASGHGIDFSGTADAPFGNTTNRQELLDDYEEGQWLPEYSGASSAGSVSYSYRKGYYIKIGAQVTVWIEMTISSSSGMSGATQISNLPFNKNDLGGAGSNGSQTYYYSGTTNWYIEYHAQNKPIFTGWMPNNSNVIRIYNANHWGSVTLAPLNTNGRMSFSYTYTTSA